METFFDLLKDPAHWEFEVFLMVVFDVVIGIFIWPFIQKALTHHKSDHERLEDLENEVKVLKEKNKSS